MVLLGVGQGENEKVQRGARGGDRRGNHNKPDQKEASNPNTTLTKRQKAHNTTQGSSTVQG